MTTTKKSKMRTWTPNAWLYVLGRKAYTVRRALIHTEDQIKEDACGQYVRGENRSAHGSIFTRVPATQKTVRYDNGITYLWLKKRDDILAQELMKPAYRLHLEKRLDLYQGKADAMRAEIEQLETELAPKEVS